MHQLRQTKGEADYGHEQEICPNGNATSTLVDRNPPRYQDDSSEDGEYQDEMPDKGA